MSSDFSTETFQARKEWCEIFKVMKSKDLQPRLLYPGVCLYQSSTATKVKGLALRRREREKIKEGEKQSINKMDYIHIYQ